MILFVFVLVQAVAFGMLRVLDQLPDLTRGLTGIAVLQLSAVQLSGILACVIVVMLVGATPSGIGLSSWRAGGGWRMLAPVGLLVIAPGIGYSIAVGDPLIAAGMSPALAAALVLLAVLVAVNEELWFRGIVVERLGGDRRPLLAVTVSALLFGLPHVAASSASWLNAAAVTLAVGVPFAVVRLRSKSLVAPIGWHAIIDIWAFLHTASVVPEGEPELAQIAVSLLVPGMIATGYLVSLRRWQERSQAPGSLRH